MFISSLTIKNFRCLYNVSMEFEPLIALIGRNGAGKSSVLRALEIFYNISAPISEEDFYNRDVTNEIVFSVEYGHLRVDELEEFAPYVFNNKLIVTKKISMSGGTFSQRYYSAFPQYPRFAEIRAIEGAMDKRRAWADFVEDGEFPDLENARSEPEVNEKMAEFEINHSDLLEPIEREEQFFGPPNIGGGKLDNYTKFLLIPAVKDVSDELLERRGSSLYQLLDLIVHRRIEARDDIVQKRSDIEAQVKELFDPDNLPELSELGNGISQLLDSFFPGAGLILAWDEVQIPNIPLPSARSRLVEDDFEGDIDKKGHGLQRALLITLLQYLVQIPIFEKEENVPDAGLEDDQEDAQAPNLVSPSLILAIEEPELYLHPLRCKYLSSLFNEITQIDEENPVFRNQIVFSSHSPHFVDLKRFENIRIMRKIRTQEEPVAVTLASSFSIDSAINRLTEVANLNPGDVTEESFKSRIIPVMSSMANEGFFADLVVIVEGFGDAGILMKLQEILDKNWLSLGIAVIPIEGKTKLDRSVLIFQGLEVPVYLVFDGDKRNEGTDQEGGTIQANHILLRLVGAEEEDFPRSQVAPTWATFEHNIEHDMRQAIGDEAFDSIRDDIASEFSITRPSQVTKNLYCASRFIEEIYTRGLEVPILEDIVDAITSLVTPD